jgi:hypothetical protein
VIASNHLPVDRVKLVYRRIINLCRMTASLEKPRSHILNRGTLPRPYLRGLSVFVNQHLPVIDALDLSRFGAAPLIAFTATKEIDYGIETDGRVSPRCGAYRADQRADTQASCR